MRRFVIAFRNRLIYWHQFVVHNKSIGDVGVERINLNVIDVDLFSYDFDALNRDILAFGVR